MRLRSNGRLVDFSGRNIGFLSGDNLYNDEGRHVGWYEGGIMRDHGGFCTGFGENVTDQLHPLLPVRQLKPVPALPRFEPLRPPKRLSPLKPYKSFRWSNFDPIDLFLMYE